MFDIEDLELTEAERDKQIDEGKKIEAMTQTEGWALFERDVKQRIEDLKSALIAEKNLDNIPRIQEAIKWGLAIQNYINVKVSNAKILLNQKTREEHELE